MKPNQLPMKVRPQNVLMRARPQNVPLIPGIAAGALIGAVALNALLRLCCRGVLTDLFDPTRFLILVLFDAFTTPWGAIGALIGGTMAWKQLHPQPEPAGIPRESSRIFHPGEAMLAWGFACLLVSFGVYPSVMTWFLAVLMLPLASVLLLGGLLRARDGSASASERLAGFGLLLLGVVALGAAALAGTHLSFRLALSSYDLAHQIQQPTGPLPGFAQWAQFAGICLIPVSLIGPGLRLWTDWSSRRYIGWCVVILVFPVAALLLHRFLVAIGFLSLSA